MPHTPDDVDSQIMIHYLSYKEIQKLLLDNIDSTITYDEMITLYQHHRLQCMPLIFLQILSNKWVLSMIILNVK